MRILQTLVESSTFRDPAANPERTARFRELLTKAQQHRADVLLLPGGYWTVATQAEVEPLAVEMCALAAKHSLTLVAGIDLPPPSATTKRTSRRADLPYYGIVGVPGMSLHCWQQTSSDNTNALNVTAADIPGPERVVQVGTQTLGILICGEIFSVPARTRLADQNPTVVVDLGHAGMGQGLIPAMRSLARMASCTVIHSQHVKYDTSSLHMVNHRGTQESIIGTDCDWVGEEAGFWVAYTLRTV